MNTKIATKASQARIDQFYLHPSIGPIKYIGMDDGWLLFDTYANFGGNWVENKNSLVLSEREFEGLGLKRCLAPA